MDNWFRPIVSTLLCLLISTTVVAAAVRELCNPHDKKALLAFKKTADLPSWEAEIDCCKHWYGVKCDAAGRVIYLYILGGGNFSSLQPELGDLTFLRSFRFHKIPNLSGTIPSSITKLKHLYSADFSYNNLSGPIPSFFHRMTILYDLNLSFNRFSGSIPPELGLAPSLISLHLSHNLLNGPIPESFGHFPITGSVTFLGMSPETSFYYLDISHNQLSGPIPSSMGNINFTHIDMSRNNLTGDASFLFGKNKPLQLLDLSRNQLSFNFSTVEIPTGRTSLDLNHNKIFGGFPTTGMENVSYLNVSYNRLCGAIPNVGRLPTFDQNQYIHNKCLCGPPLPACA